jgi:hypothetical protein
VAAAAAAVAVAVAVAVDNDDDTDAIVDADADADIDSNMQASFRLANVVGIWKHSSYSVSRTPDCEACFIVSAGAMARSQELFRS